MRLANTAYKIVILTIAASDVNAAVNGDPSLHMPCEPDGWVHTDNDNLFPNQPDDAYTAGLGVGLRIGKRFTLGASDAMLTHKTSVDGLRFHGTRTDELTLSAGLYIIEAKGWTVIAAGGARMTGDFGGEEVQNADHSRTKNAPIDFAYDGRSLRPLALIECSRDVHCGVYGLAPLFILASTGDAVEMEGRLPFYVSSDDCAAWLGPLWHEHKGRDVGSTSSWVHRKYDGLFLTAGIKILHAQIIAYGSRNVGYASIGINF